MHMYGGNSLISALDRIDQKVPKINEIPENGKIYSGDYLLKVGIDVFSDDRLTIRVIELSVQ